MLKRVIDTWIDIDASPERVWRELVDLASWSSWNPFIPLAAGNLQVGEQLRIKVVAPGLKPMIFKPEVYIVEENQQILWGGSFLWWVYRGDHAFLLEPLEEGRTRFRQIERFRGPMVLLMSTMIKNTEKGYRQMNLALKRHIEADR